MSEPKKKQGFAALSPERLRQITSSGGIARKKAFDEMKRAAAQARPQPDSRK